MKAKLSVAEIIELARAKNLGSRRIRSLLFRNGHDPGVYAPQVRAALGRGTKAADEESTPASPPEKPEN